MSPTSKAQQKAVHNYVRNNYDRINLTVKKGTKQSLQEVAKESGESINGYIKNAIQSRYKAETGADIDL